MADSRSRGQPFGQSLGSIIISVRAIHSSGQLQSSPRGRAAPTGARTRSSERAPAPVQAAQCEVVVLGLEIGRRLASCPSVPLAGAFRDHQK